MYNHVVTKKVLKTRPGHLMQHSITLLLGQIALTQPGGVFSVILLLKTNDSPTKRNAVVAMLVVCLEF